MTIERGDAFEPIPERLVVANGSSTYTLANWTTGRRLSTTARRSIFDGTPTPMAAADRGFFNDIVEGRDVDTLYRVIAHALYRNMSRRKPSCWLAAARTLSLCS